MWALNESDNIRANEQLQQPCQVGQQAPVTLQHPQQQQLQPPQQLQSPQPLQPHQHQQYQFTPTPQFSAEVLPAVGPSQVSSIVVVVVVV